jgi:hypothetical protein
MSIFQAFGSAGATLANLSPLEPTQPGWPYPTFLQQALQQYKISCIHGENCPVCAKVKRVTEKAYDRIRKQELKEELASKKAYEKRCKDYMKWFRKKKVGV